MKEKYNFSVQRIREPDPFKYFASEWIESDKAKGIPEWKTERLGIIMLSRQKTRMGYARLEIRGGVCRIKEFLICKKYRSRGIGSYFLGRILVYALTEFNCHKVSLSTIEKPKVSSPIQFYEKRGFKVVGAYPNDAFGLTRIEMEKMI